MAKVLKITKPDKTVHIVPVENKASLQAFNNRQSADRKWKIEEIDEAEAENLPFIDENYVTGSEAIVKNSELQKTVQSQEETITELRRQLAERNSSSSNSGQSEESKRTAAEVISLIEAAKSAEEVDALAAGDERLTVKAAADKKKQSFSK